MMTEMKKGIAVVLKPVNPNESISERALMELGRRSQSFDFEAIVMVNDGEVLAEVAETKRKLTVKMRMAKMASAYHWQVIGEVLSASGGVENIGVSPELTGAIFRRGTMITFAYDIDHNVACVYMAGGRSYDQPNGLCFPPMNADYHEYDPDNGDKRYTVSDLVTLDMVQYLDEEDGPERAYVLPTQPPMQPQGQSGPLQNQGGQPLPQNPYKGNAAAVG